MVWILVSTSARAGLPPEDGQATLAVDLVTESAPKAALLLDVSGAPSIAPWATQGVGMLLDLQRWTPTEASTALTCTRFAYEPTKDWSSSWADFGMRQAVGFQNGVRPDRPRGLILSVTIDDGFFHPSDEKSSQGLDLSPRTLIDAAVDSSLESVPRWVAGGVASALE